MKLPNSLNLWEGHSVGISSLNMEGCGSAKDDVESRGVTKKKKMWKAARLTLKIRTKKQYEQINYLLHSLLVLPSGDESQKDALF